MRQKRMALINDITGFGRCSIAVMAPIISTMRIQAVPVPTAILSTHTQFPVYHFDDYTKHMPEYIQTYKDLKLEFDGIATGFLGSKEQVEIVIDFIQSFKRKETFVLVDPVMGDHGHLYATYSKEMAESMKNLVHYADILTPNLTELVTLLDRDYPEVIPVGQIGKDGDGIRMAENAGAALEGMSTVEAYRPGLAGFHPADQMIALAVQPYFWVGPNAERYTDESNVEFWPSSGNALVRIGGTAYSIYDDATRKLAVEQGIEMPLGEWVLQGTKLTKWEESFAKELARKRGNVFKADTIADLAKQIGLDPSVLKTSVEKMNTAAATRLDTQFNKNPKYLRPVSTPPFYATKLLPRHLGTLGGVRISSRTEAVDAKGVKIPGLYATGTDAGGMYGDSYDLMLGGGTAGFAVNSGRIAAENALVYAGITKQGK